MNDQNNNVGNNLNGDNGNNLNVNNNVDTPSFPNVNNGINPVPPMISSSEDNGEKKKVIIILGIVVLLIIVIVLIVFSNKDSSSSNTTNNSDNKDKVVDKKEDVNKRDTIYYYKVTTKTDGYTYVTASYTTLKNYQDHSYEEISKYSCKGTCVYGVKSESEVEKSELYIADDDKLYRYNYADNKYEELSFDRELSGKNVEFKISDTMIVAYNDEWLTVSEDRVSLSSVKKIEVNGIKTTLSEEVYTNREILKDDIYAVKEDYEEYQVFKFYVKDNKIAEIKEKDGPYISNITYDGNFIVLDGGSKNHLIVNKNGNIQKVTKEGRYSLYDNKLVVANDSGSVEVYDVDKLISTTESTSSRIAGRGYAVMIKDNKLLLYDAINNQLIYDFGSISATEKFIESKYDTSVYYSNSNYQIVSVFLEDTAKPRDDSKVFGRYFTYNFNSKESTIDTEYYKYAS